MVDEVYEANGAKGGNDLLANFGFFLVCSVKKMREVNDWDDSVHLGRLGMVMVEADTGGGC